MDKSIIKMFEDNLSLPTISKEMGLSLDQIKRLKRLYSYTEIVRPLVSRKSFEAFTQLNQSVFVLKPLIDELDAEGLNEILEQVDMTTSRSELKMLVESYTVKKQRIELLVKEQKYRIENIERQESLIKETVDELEKQYERLKDFVSLPKPYPKNIQKLLIRYVTPYSDGYALRRRFDSGFQKQLKQANVITMRDYIWHVNSVERLAEMMATRIKNRGAIEWNYNKEIRRSHLYEVSKDDKYKAIANEATSIDEVNMKIAEYLSEIEDLKEEKQSMISEMNKIRKSNIRSWHEAAIYSNGLSEREILKHKELQNLALRWLYTNGYVACSEITLPNKRRADVIGYKDGQVIIIEVKASREDYNQDDKWQQYLNWCDRFYFLGDIYKYERYADTGYLEEYGNSLKESEPDCLQHACKDYNTIHGLINRTLSKRFIYGF